MGVKRTTIWISDEDREAIRAVKVRFGVASDSDAIRLAVRVLAEAKEIGLSPLPAWTPQDARTGRDARHVKEEEPRG